jgi:hypothetical protein
MTSTGLYVFTYYLTAALIFASPVWMLIAFAAYWSGRKTFSLRALFALVTLEAIAIGFIAVWLRRIDD